MFTIKSKYDIIFFGDIREKDGCDALKLAIAN